MAQRSNLIFIGWGIVSLAGAGLAPAAAEKKRHDDAAPAAAGAV